MPRKSDSHTEDGYHHSFLFLYCPMFCTALHMGSQLFADNVMTELDIHEHLSIIS